MNISVGLLSATADRGTRSRNFFYRRDERLRRIEASGSPLTSMSTFGKEETPLFRLLDLHDCKLAVDPVALEGGLVTRFHSVEHRRALSTEDHGHTHVHVELLDRTVLDGDLAGGCVDLDHLTVDRLCLRHRDRQRQAMT